MAIRNVVIGQQVAPAKVEAARRLRREQTPAERLLWQSLRANRLAGFHFRRQQVIDGFIVDFYCHQAAVIVEADGRIHEGQADYDQERDKMLTDRGFLILRFTNEQLQSALPEILRTIATTCRGRVSPLPRPLPEAGRGD